MPYSPKEFIRRAPNDLLKLYLARRGLLLDYPWEKFVLASSDPVYDAWRALPASQRDPTVAEWSRIAEFDTLESVRLLADEGRCRGVDVATAAKTHASPWAQALWVFLHQPDLFDSALQFERADHLHGRYWRKRTDLPRKPPDVGPEARAALGNSLSALFKNEDRGGLCHVRWDLRGGRRHYLAAYPEDTAALVERYDGTELVSRCDKAPFQVLYVYDPEDGTLDLHAHGDRHLHAELAQRFAREILKAALPPEPKIPIRYRLQPLARRDFGFPIDPKDGIDVVRVQHLEVLVEGGHVAVGTDGRHRGHDVHDLLERSLRGHGTPISNVDVERATLEMVFRHDAEVLPIHMTQYRCNLRSDRPRHVLARRCLAHWGLAVA